MSFAVNTPVFEGPFDLLLHLILREQIDLYEVELSTIVDAYLAELERMVDSEDGLDLDIATVAEMAARAARDAGQPVHAERAYRLALTQWLALGRDDSVARVSSQLEALVGSA